MNDGYRLGVDTGGTFTDLCILDESSGNLFVTKIPSTPFNPAVAVISGIEKLLEVLEAYPGTTEYAFTDPKVFKGDGNAGHRYVAENY